MATELVQQVVEEGDVPSPEPDWVAEDRDEGDNRFYCVHTDPTVDRASTFRPPMVQSGLWFCRECGLAMRA